MGRSHCCSTIWTPPRPTIQANLADDRGLRNAAHALAGLARVHVAAGRLDAAQLDAAQQTIQALADLVEGEPRIQELSATLQGLRGETAWRQGDQSRGEQLLHEAVAACRQRHADLETVPFLYELRDLYQQQGRTPEAVRVMAQALDLLSECGAERGVLDVEEWLRAVDSPALVRLALERHFSDYLVEGLLSGQLAQQPTRRQEITVLFSDLRNCTTLSERLPPEEVVEILNEWFTEATRAIRQHGGMVDKFIGDAVMALFGVLEPGDDAAADAVRAALAMRDALATLNLRSQALGGRTIHIGIGIHTGEAIVGFIGSHLRQSYTAIGDTVNTASRLESATKQYPGRDILFSEQTAQRLQGAAETQFLGLEELKGKKEQVPVYQVLGRRAEM